MYYTSIKFSEIWFWSFKVIGITLIFVQLLIFVISLILASNLMLYKWGMSLWLIGSAGVWAGVWFHGSTSRHYCADSGSTSRHYWLRLQTNLYFQTNLYCADSGSKRISTAQTQAPPHDTTAQTQAPNKSLLPNESLLHRLGLQTNLYCEDSGSKRISTAQTQAPNKSLLRRLGLQTNLYCADWLQTNL